LDREIGRAAESLAEYDIIAAVNARGLLRELEFDPGSRRLGELSPPQKTRRLNRQGRTLKITLDLLVRGSCNISRPFADAKTLRSYLLRGESTRLRRRLESDAKSLLALYHYGCLHHGVRLRWGFLDEMIPAPWVHRDETSLFGLMRQAQASGVTLEVVTGSAPGWSDPWARARRAIVMTVGDDWRFWLVDEEGSVFDERDVQLARLVEPE
jgi:hypothetical protein